MKEKGKNKGLIRGIVITCVLIAVVGGIYKYIQIQKYENTDDSQIEGDISPVLPKVSGYITEIRFSDNQNVKKGDTLVKLDDSELKVKVMQSEAALENAKASLNAIRSNVSASGSGAEASKSAIETAKIRVWKTSQDFARYEKLLAEKSVTQQQYDAARAEKETAEAQLKTATKQYESSLSQQNASQQQISVAEANIHQKEADLEFAKLQLSYATVVAPATGLVSKKSIQLGQLVQIAQPLCAIVVSENVWVVANFKETQITKMHEGQEVEIDVDAFKGTKLHGRVSSFSGATGAKFSLLPPDNATGNFVKVVQRIPVKISFDKENESEIYKMLKPGMSVAVSVNVKS